jgi:hypothetical protein
LLFLLQCGATVGSADVGSVTPWPRRHAAAHAGGPALPALSRIDPSRRGSGLRVRHPLLATGRACGAHRRADRRLRSRRIAGVSRFDLCAVATPACHGGVTRLT